MYCKLTTGCELSFPATGHSTGCMSHTDGEFQMQTPSALPPPPASKRNTDPSQTVWVGKPGPPKYPSGAPAGLARSLQPPVAWVAVLAALLSARPLMCPQWVHSNPPQPLIHCSSHIPSHWRQEEGSKSTGSRKELESPSILHQPSGFSDTLRIPRGIGTRRLLPQLPNSLVGT